MYVQQALSTFKASILEPYCSHHLNIPIYSFEQALYECHKYDNNKYQMTIMNFMRHKVRPNNFTKNPQTVQNTRPQQTNFPTNQQYQIPHYNNNNNAGNAPNT